MELIFSSWNLYSNEIKSTSYVFCKNNIYIVCYWLYNFLKMESIKDSKSNIEFSNKDKGLDIINNNLINSNRGNTPVYFKLDTSNEENIPMIPIDYSKKPRERLKFHFFLLYVNRRVDEIFFLLTSFLIFIWGPFTLFLMLYLFRFI